MAKYLVVVLALFHVSAAAVLHDFVNVCSANDPKINECVRNSLQAVWPRMVKGIKDIGILSMDPMSVPLIQIQQGQAGNGGLSVNLTKTKHYGWKSCIFKNVKVDPKKLHFEFDMYLPKYVILGDYKIAGRVLVLPIAGSGASNVTIFDCVTKVELNGKLEERGGKKYMKLSTIQTKISVGRSFIQMENLFGNKELSESMNRFLNENAKELIQDFMPAFEEVTSHLYRGILEGFFRKVPYNAMFRNL